MKIPFRLCRSSAFPTYLLADSPALHRAGTARQEVVGLLAGILCRQWFRQIRAHFGLQAAALIERKIFRFLIRFVRRVVPMILRVYLDASDFRYVLHLKSQRHGHDSTVHI